MSTEQFRRKKSEFHYAGKQTDLQNMSKYWMMNVGLDVWKPLNSFGIPDLGATAKPALAISVRRVHVYKGSSSPVNLLDDVDIAEMNLYLWPLPVWFNPDALRLGRVVPVK